MNPAKTKPFERALAIILALTLSLAMTAVTGRNSLAAVVADPCPDCDYCTEQSYDILDCVDFCGAYCTQSHSVCGGTGRVACSGCEGSGEALDTCPTCNGAGSFTFPSCPLAAMHAILSLVGGCPLCPILGTLRVDCSGCAGISDPDCMACLGTDEIPCPALFAHSIFFTLGGTPCPMCNNTNVVPCTECGGKVSVPCPSCDGALEEDCQGCETTGYVFLPRYGVSLDVVGGAYDFGTTHYNHATPAPLTVTVSNTGNRATGTLTIALFGEDADSFVLSQTSAASIAVGGAATFTVVPKAGIKIGSHTASVSMNGSYDLLKVFHVSFTVSPRGDANEDSIVSASDAAAILRYLVELQFLSAQGLKNAKVTAGTNPVSAADAARILRWLVQLETVL
ncbi:MAG: hypothetical protein FWE69_02400 [Clostridiales bacterium]|nr:hypothetical protein [Clostridiales bacterium]